MYKQNKEEKNVQLNEIKEKNQRIGGIGKGNRRKIDELTIRNKRLQFIDAKTMLMRKRMKRFELDPLPAEMFHHCAYPQRCVTL